MKGKSGTSRRRESKKQILQKQLELGTKPVKKNPGKREPMTDSDIKRVEKEIKILEGPIMKYRRKNKKYDKEGKQIG